MLFWLKKEVSILDNIYSIKINKTIRLEVAAKNPEDALNQATKIMADNNAKEIINEHTSYQIYEKE